MIAAILIIGFSVIQLLVALANLLFHQPLKESQKEFSRLVSVLIPARNEENNIGNLLSDLSNQNYPHIEVLVYDDQSEDDTGKIVWELALKDRRIRLIHGGNLPEGWLGKTRACHRLAMEAKGDFLLFLDADVRLIGDIIRKTAVSATELKTGLLSVFPVQIMATAGEWSAVPLMHFILLTLLPLILVKKSGFPSLSAANGQFMFFDAEIYRALNPHERMKADKVEDISIARWYKKSGISVSCLTGITEIRCRMYNGFYEAVKGFAKNVKAFFGKSFILAFLFWAITTFGWAFVFLTMGKIFGLTYLMILLVTRILVSLAAKQKVLLNILFWIPQQITLGFILIKAMHYKLNRKYQWKGRIIR